MSSPSNSAHYSPPHILKVCVFKESKEHSVVDGPGSKTDRMADINVEEVLKKLSRGDKCDLLAGIDFWHTKALPEHGVPSLRTSDGPNGVRGTK